MGGLSPVSRRGNNIDPQVLYLACRFPRHSSDLRYVACKHYAVHVLRSASVTDDRTLWGYCVNVACETCEVCECMSLAGAIRIVPRCLVTTRYGFSWGCDFYKFLHPVSSQHPIRQTRTCFEPSSFAYTSVTWRTASLLLVWEIMENWTMTPFSYFRQLVPNTPQSSVGR